MGSNRRLNIVSLPVRALSLATLFVFASCGSSNNPAPTLPVTPTTTNASAVGGGLEQPNPGTPIYQSNSAQLLQTLASNLNGYGSGQVNQVTEYNLIIDPTQPTPLVRVGTATTDQFQPQSIIFSGSGSGQNIQFNLTAGDGTKAVFSYVPFIRVGPNQLYTTDQVAMFQGSNGSIVRVLNYATRGSMTLQEFYVTPLGNVWNSGANYPTSSYSGGGGSGLHVREVDIGVSLNYPQYAQPGQGGWNGYNGNYTH